MSKIVKKTGYRELSHVVQTDDGQYFMVDSNNTFDCGYETMVFEWNIEEDGVDNWIEKYCERYESEKDMENRHKEICKHLEECLDK